MHINNNVDASGTMNGTSSDSMPLQKNVPVKSSQPVTPKKKVLASKKKLSSFLRVTVVNKPSLPQIIREPFQSQVLAPIACISKSRTPASYETMSNQPQQHIASRTRSKKSLQSIPQNFLLHQINDTFKLSNKKKSKYAASLS